MVPPTTTKPSQTPVQTKAQKPQEQRSAPPPVLREGSKGPHVANLQRALHERGYTLTADGDYGPKTRAAVERFQRDRGLSVDGVAGPQVAEALKGAGAARATPLSELPPNTVLREGARGEGVRRLQQRLVEHGARIDVDGAYGPKTRAAVTDFQKRHQLGVDGVAGPETIGALVRAAPEGGSAAAPAVDRAASRARARAALGTGRVGDVPTTGSARGAEGPARTATAQGARGTARVEAPRNPNVVTDVKLIKDLAPVKGSAVGSAQMAIFDNPETIHDFGLVGSTIAKLKDRPGNTVHDFDGKARLYSIVNNQTQNTLAAGINRHLGRDKLSNIHNSVVVHNPTDKPLVIHIEGTVYSKGITRTDKSIPESYKRNGGFRGPQAISASAYMKARPGENGYVRKALTIPPGGTRVVSDVYQAPGGEVFTLLDMKANGKFRLAQVATPKQLTDDDLRRITAGEFQSAGAAFRLKDRKSDFAPTGEGILGRPNGVVDGSVFKGGGRVDVGAGRSHGELLMATSVKRAEPHDDLMRLRAVPGNKGLVGPAATTNDGAYGMTYDLNYSLENSSGKTRKVQVVLTSPRHDYEAPFNPDGGMLTIPVKLNGVQRNLRVSARGTGTLVGTVDVPPGARQNLRIQMTNLGNIYPPIGLEFRPVDSAAR